MTAPERSDRANERSSSLAVQIPGVNPQLRVVTDGLTYEVWNDHTGDEGRSPEEVAHLEFDAHGVTEEDVLAILDYRREAKVTPSS